MPYQINFLQGFALSIDDAKTFLSNIKINDKKTNKTLLDIPELDLKGFYLKWPKQSASIDNLTINNASILAVLNKNGEINLAEAFATKNNSKVKNKKTQLTKPWKFILKSANINKTNVVFTNNNLKYPVKSNLSKISLHVKNITSIKKDPISYTLSTILNKKTDIKISGDVMREPLSLNSKVQLSNLMLGDFFNYIKPYVNFKIKNASIDADANISANLEKKVSIKVLANTTINNLSIDSLDGKSLLKWKSLEVDGIKYNNNPMSIDINNLKLNKPYIRVHIAKNGTTNFSNLIKENKKSKEKKKSKTSLKLKIGPMKLVNGTTDYSDASLPFPFSTHIHDLNGNVLTLDFGSTTPSTVNLSGKINKYGYADIKGKIAVFDVKKSADIYVLFKNIDLNSLTPYSGKFLGYKIKHGKLSMDLNYKISNGSLKGTNKINLDTLNLGESQE